MSDIVKRLREGVFGSDTTKTDAFLHSLTHAAADEIEKLREALRVAMDAVEYWASYASPYFQEKHDLAGDLQKLRAALGEKE